MSQPVPFRQHAERYVERHELAARMGVSGGTVDNLRREGMPSVTWGRRTRRFLPSVCIAWAASRDHPDMDDLSQRRAA